VSRELLIATHRARLPEKIKEKKDGTHTYVKKSSRYGMDYNHYKDDEYTHFKKSLYGNNYEDDIRRLASE
jgi:hypothetical protein